jgi:hypothetical protein
MTRPAYAAGMMQAADRVVAPKVGSATSGQQTGSNRCPKRLRSPLGTVEDHDRRFSR